MRNLQTSLVLALSTLSKLGFAAYTWPSPQYDALEALLYEGRTPGGSSLTSLVHPCKRRVGTLSLVPAEWLRFAFHDMATHNADDGTGGLDGSIVYELDRPENHSLGLNATLGDFENLPNKYVSRSDVIALGAVFAVATCGGPVIPFRGGRIDSFSPGGTGTPEPQHDLETLTEMFRKQGFTQSEMIKLVSCGHTMGGVRSADFPDLVPPGSNPNIPVIQDFDTTPAFDNHVVTEYLDGSTQNVLVTTGNTTMASDLRVFESDGNETMRSISEPDAFQSECRDVLGRMLEVVPRGVALTEEIALLPAKVRYAQLAIEKEKLVFKTSLRVTQPIGAALNNDRVVTLFWCDKRGSNADCRQNSRSAVHVRRTNEDPNLSPVTFNLGTRFISYDFVVPISSSQSISKFWFEVDEKNGERATKINNDGLDYPIDQDEVFFVPMLSTVEVFSNGTDEKIYINRNQVEGEAFHRSYNLVVGVRQDTNPERVYVDGFDSSVLGFPYAVNVTVDLTLDDARTPIEGYKFYTAKLESSGLQLTIDVNADVGGTKYKQDFVQTAVLDNTPYVAPATVSTGSSKPSSAGVRESWSVIAATLSAALSVLYCMDLLP
ncbi:L-ascorbate oxidase [Coprinopsis marcescibilis]|uniref:Peroxidase n=1 Tax=Coprinopsis marcescibilis TaxID=230819 RepID=A0A5C3LBH8_COPMA|nr:L-ascorbate oxidase [Coprinopsis marcescibilis]